MDTQEKVEYLKENSFAFDVDLTLGEMEWSRILGPQGFGERLLQNMAGIGARWFQLDQIEYGHGANGEVVRLAVDGARCQFSLEHGRSLTATLLDGVRTVLDSINRALRRASLPVRYICAREDCIDSRCRYRVMLLPTAWLRELDDELNIVAGVSLDDYEHETPSWPTNAPHMPYWHPPGEARRPSVRD